MTRNELFWLLVVTIAMVIPGTREIVRRNFAFGALLVLIPVAGWAAIWFGK